MLSKQQCLETLDANMMRMYFDAEYTEFDADGYYLGGLIFTDDTFVLRGLYLGKKNLLKQNRIIKFVPVVRGTIKEVAGGCEITIAFTTLKRIILFLSFWFILGNVACFSCARYFVANGDLDSSMLTTFIISMLAVAVIVMLHRGYTAEVKKHLERTFMVE